MSDDARPTPAPAGAHLGEDGPPTTSSPGAAAGSAVEVIRSEERLVAGTESRVTEIVRIGKRVVTEERTVTVTVRREELYVERSPGTGAPATTSSAGRAPRNAGPVLTMTLSQEEPVVTTRVVPLEVVRVHVDRTTDGVRLSEDVRREVVDVDLDVDVPGDPQR